MKSFNQKMLFLSLGLLIGAVPVYAMSGIGKARDLETVNDLLDKVQIQSFKNQVQAYIYIVDNARATLFTEPTETEPTTNFFQQQQPPISYWENTITRRVIPFMQQYASQSQALAPKLKTLISADKLLRESFNVRQSIQVGRLGSTTTLTTFNNTANKIKSELNLLRSLSQQLNSHHSSLSAHVNKLTKEIDDLQHNRGWAKIKTQSQKQALINTKQSQLTMSIREQQLIPLFMKLNWVLINAFEKIYTDYQIFTQK